MIYFKMQFLLCGAHKFYYFSTFQRNLILMIKIKEKLYKFAQIEKEGAFKSNAKFARVPMNYTKSSMQMVEGKTLFHYNIMKKFVKEIFLSLFTLLFSL